jgi:hypothetical protein
VIVHSTDDLNPLSPSVLFETMVGRFVSDIARGASSVRQRSMMLSIEDNRDSLARRRERLDDETATYIAALVNLARDHGLDALRGLGLTDLEIVRIAVAPLNREPGPVPAGRNPLDTFEDERLFKALWELSNALRSWRACDEQSPEEAGALVLDRLAKVTAALERREEARS